jgi:outer membrane protein assembly factor BamB
LVVTKKDMPIFFINENGIIVFDIFFADLKIATYPIYISNRYLSFFGLDSKNNDTEYVVDKHFKTEQLFPPYYRPIINQYIGYHFGEIVVIKNLETGFEWQTNINALPKKNVQEKPYTSEFKEQPYQFYGGANEVLFACEGILYVSTSGALLAYNIETGKLLFDDIIGGWTDLYDGKVYAINPNGLFVSDAQTGKLINSTEDIIYIREEDSIDKSSTVVNRFVTNIKVFEDYIICTDSFWGKIAFFDRKTLKRERVVDVSGLGAGRDNIIWYENRLYILGVGDVLFVYE